VSRIQRLPPDLANQIAAGEVVERPASVVKELVENAIDAGATRVSVAIELGGKALIQVEDDGEGMTPADAALAVERHATSKIHTAADLAAIHTLGFRGEALPSIASVSRFRLRSRPRAAVLGTEVRVDGGRLAGVRDAGAPEGTLVEVADLFFNLPARRKFLKADTAEAAQVSRLVTQLALGYPDIGWTLRSGGRLLLETPPAGSLEARFYQIYGDRPDLVPVAKDAAGIAVRGFVAALTDQGPARGPQHVFVNRRMVRDRTISHAIQQAYSQSVVKERSPEVHLFIELPAGRVDVNVHPTKAEVRFLDQGLVHEVLRRAVVDALAESAAPELVLERVAGFARAAGGGAAVAPGPFALSPARTADAAPETRGLPLAFAASGTPTEAWGSARAGTQAGREAVASLIRPMTPLGQFRHTFIVAVDDEGLVIVDQHVAHERILFEQVMERLTARPLESQRLLTPIVIDVGAGAHQTLAAHAASLQRFGFEIEDFGGASVRIAAVPAVLDWSRTETALRAVAADLDGLAPGAGVDEALRRVAATMACHAAVRAHDPLTPEKMQYLLDELRRTSHSSVCPHGRPVVLRLTRREIERNFERV
jgi:DNA mismatch repair protein MutL